jgi:conjugal transfer pilus assembly protein TraA
LYPELLFAINEAICPIGLDLPSLRLENLILRQLLISQKTQNNRIITLNIAKKGMITTKLPKKRAYYTKRPRIPEGVFFYLEILMKKKLVPMIAVLLALFVTLAPDLALAGTDTTFSDIYTMIKNWMQGSLGLVISLAMILVGLGMGILNQTVAPVVIGLSGGMVLYFAPNVIGNIVTAIA